MHSTFENSCSIFRLKSKSFEFSTSITLHSLFIELRQLLIISPLLNEAITAVISLIDFI